MKEVIISDIRDFVEIVVDKDKVNVCVGDKNIGTVVYSTNPYHAENYYLELQLQQYDTKISKSIFDNMSHELNKPMQIMISSDELDVIEFIQIAGFMCKRKCYEIEAVAQDYIGEKINKPLAVVLDNHPIYQTCCKMMLERYISTHEKISPWTGSAEEFYELLPKVAYYEVENEQVINVAFVEENEIAYVYGTNMDRFAIFTQNLITELLNQYERVVFEADDCDEYAMRLKSLFINQSEECYNTYVL